MGREPKEGEAAAGAPRAMMPPKEPPHILVSYTSWMQGCARKGQSLPIRPLEVLSVENLKPLGGLKVLQ